MPHFSLQNLYLKVRVISLINGLFSDEIGLWIGLNDMNHNRCYTWQDSAPLLLQTLYLKVKVISLIINGLFSDETGLWIGLNDMNHNRCYKWQDNAPFFITNTLSYSNSDQPDKWPVL